MKNPVRVAAGKKSAEARWSKRKQAQAQQAQPEHEPIRITKESPEQPPPRPPVTVNVNIELLSTLRADRGCRDWDFLDL